MEKYMTKIPLKKSASVLKSNVNAEFFMVSVLSQSGDATAAGTSRRRSPQEYSWPSGHRDPWIRRWASEHQFFSSGM